MVNKCKLRESNNQASNQTKRREKREENKAENTAKTEVDDEEKPKTAKKEEARRCRERRGTRPASVKRSHKRNKATLTASGRGGIVILTPRVKSDRLSRMSAKDYITTAEAARILNMSQRRIQEWLNDGTLEGYKLHARTWVVKRDSVESLKNARDSKKA